ncbi:MAG: ISAs1 family transposase [Bacilli bacterium]|nr:ISAs1 family transposase [Bacilli bacterium]
MLLNTQKENIKAARANVADYVVPIKANHPTFHKELIDFFDEKQQEYIIAGKQHTGYLKKNEYKNGAMITYEYFQTREIDWYEDKNEWQDLTTIGMVKKTIVKKNIDKHKNAKEDINIEYRYYISSLGINIELFSDAIRKHWSVENKLHWHLDVTFRQDKNTTLDKNALANLEIINKFCLGILKRVQAYYNISLKRIIGKLSLNIEENFLELISLLVLADGHDKGKL